MAPLINYKSLSQIAAYFFNNRNRPRTRIFEELKEKFPENTVNIAEDILTDPSEMEAPFSIKMATVNSGKGIIYTPVYSLREGVSKEKLKEYVKRLYVFS